MQTIRLKILLGYAVLALLSATLIISSVILGGKVKTQASFVNESVLPLQQNVGSLKGIVGELESTLYAFYATSISGAEFNTQFMAALGRANDLNDTLQAPEVLAPKLEQLNEHGQDLERALKNSDWDSARQVLSDTSIIRIEIHSSLDQAIADVNTQAKQTTESIRDTMDTIISGAIVFLALVIGIFIAVAVYINRGIIAPIDALADFARSVVADSDLSKQTQIHAYDEIGRTAEAFNTMLERIRAMVETSNHAAISVNAAIQNLDQELAGANDNAERQLNNTQNIKTSVLDLQSQLSDVSSHTETAAARASSGASDATQGRAQLADTVQQIRRLSDNVAASASAITQLEQQTTSIAGLTGTIKEIADQTNLLALNAAIEAARAGEAGRGFAVVADEVRGLSQKTQTSTLEIDSTIKNIVGTVQCVVNSMEINRTLASECATASENTEARLKSIMDLIEDIRKDSENIAEATSSGHALSEGIGEQVIDLAKLSESISQGMQTSNQCSDMVKQSAQVLSQASAQFRY